MQNLIIIKGKYKEWIIKSFLTIIQITINLFGGILEPNS